MIKLEVNERPRSFQLGKYNVVDHGVLRLSSDNNFTNNLVTLVTANDRKCDIAATPWGYYLGSSTNSRLKNEGFRTALVVNSGNQLYVMAVEEGHESLFHEYLKETDAKVITWLDQWFNDTKIKSPFEGNK
jgi:hypothetical protein